MGLPDDIFALAQQLRLDTALLYKEILWALGEERINRVTPTEVQFREWKRNNDGLMLFWSYANERLGCTLSQEDAHDIWQCIDLTLRTRERRVLSFQDYLIIAVRSDQSCAVCRQRPPEVKLEIDHILPVSRGAQRRSLTCAFSANYITARVAIAFAGLTFGVTNLCLGGNYEARTSFGFQTEDNEALLLHNERNGVGAAMLCRTRN